MKRILICGSNGLVGQYLSKILENQFEFEILHTSNKRELYLKNLKSDFTQLDITNKGDVKSLVSAFKPEIIINCVAISNVDFCEKEKETAWNVNVKGVENLISSAKIIGAKLIHLSTDYIFDGNKGDYNEDDKPNPISYYGRTKLAAENSILESGINFCILRPIVIFGFGKNLKYNFPFWVVESLREGKNISCATDQISNPTYAGQIAEGIISVIKNDFNGIYNFCGDTKISRFDLAKLCAKIFNLNGELISPITSDELKQIAKRPKNTTMDLSKAKKDFKIKFLEISEALEKFKNDENL